MISKASPHKKESVVKEVRNLMGSGPHSRDGVELLHRCTRFEKPEGGSMWFLPKFLGEGI